MRVSVERTAAEIGLGMAVGDLASTDGVDFGLDVVPLSRRSVGGLGPGQVCSEPRSSPGAFRGIAVADLYPSVSE